MAAQDLSEKRKNPIVDRYVTTDLSLSAILAQLPDPGSPVIRALLYLQECLDGKRLAREALDAAQAAPMKGSDPELVILMLTRWAELSCRIGQPSNADVILHRARALLGEETHPEVRAGIMLIESMLADTTGNKKRCEEILREVLKLVPQHSARRKLHVWELALLLARQGRGTDARDEFNELSWQTNDRFKMSRLLLVRFVDAVETGQVHEASRLMSEIKTTVHRPSDIARIPFSGYQALLSEMHGVLSRKDRVENRAANESDGMAARSGPSDREQDVAPWIQVVRALLASDKDKALRTARQEANRMESIFGAGFDSFNLIRAELAAGSWESAARLLKMRQARGNDHYLDDLFAARAELLAENHKQAARHFADLLKSCDYYRAGGRLDFELSLAAELSQGEIVRLTSSAEKAARRTRGLFRRKPEAPGVPRSAEQTQTLRGIKVILGSSAAMSEVRQAVMRYADLEAPVLITGETGTGKELVARALHETSGRRAAPFTAINCGSITETLLESELFGHERGAFTGAERSTQGLFEATGEGTILLDEIGDVSPRLQATLLRVLETGEIRAVGSSKTRKIRCRIVAATNADLNVLADDGRFRKDLLYRLQRLGIYLPPLRERRRDIVPLVRHFLDLERRIGAHAAVSNDLKKALTEYDWPGNVRELRNVIERMRLMHSDKLTYTLDDLDLKFHAVNAGPPASAPIAGIVAEPVKDATLNAPRKEPYDAGPRPGDIAEGDVKRIIRSGTSPVRRLDRLRDLFREYKKLTRGEIIEIMGVSPNTATKYLEELISEGLIDRVEPSASTRSHYFVLKNGA